MSIDTTAWKLRRTAHLNGGPTWFGYLYECVQEPRLERLDRYDRKTHLVTSTWRVDGDEMADFSAAMAVLEVQL